MPVTSAYWLQALSKVSQWSAYSVIFTLLIELAQRDSEVAARSLRSEKT